MQKLNKGGGIMFSDEVYEKIFSRSELERIDIQTQSIVIHAIEEVLEEVRNDNESIYD